MSPLDAGSADAERVWTAGDLIEVKYEMKLRAEKSGEDREIFWFGPWLLGVSAADNPAYFNELTTGNRLFGTPEAALVTNPRRPPFFVPVATAQTDYAQAEYPDQPGRVILRPIAEQTGQATTSWELRLLKRKS